MTSADDRLAKARLTAAGITPRVLVTTDGVAAGKPDPAGYLRAACSVPVTLEWDATPESQLPLAP